MGVGPATVPMGQVGSPLPSEPPSSSAGCNSPSPVCAQSHRLPRQGGLYVLLVTPQHRSHIRNSLLVLQCYQGLMGRSGAP